MYSNPKQIVAVAVLILFSYAALGNGINPPAPEGTSTVKCTCITIDGKQIILSKSRFIPLPKIPAAIDGAIRRMLLSQIQRLDIDQKHSSHRDTLFGKAKLVDKQDITQVDIPRINNFGDSLKIRGYNIDGESDTITIGKCITITTDATIEKYDNDNMEQNRGRSKK